MKVCLNCQGKGIILVKSAEFFYKNSTDYYSQKCSSCEGKGYIWATINNGIHERNLRL